MAKYRVNKVAYSPNNDHEVHQKGCPWWPMISYIELSDHSHCLSAVTEAKKYFNDPNGCVTCAKACHIT